MSYPQPPQEHTVASQHDLSLILQAIGSVGDKVESVRRELSVQIEATNKELTTFKLAMPDAYVPRREHTERWEGETEKFAQLSARQDQSETRVDQIREDLTAVRGEVQALRNEIRLQITEQISHIQTEEAERREKTHERVADQAFTRNQALLLAFVTLIIGYIVSNFQLIPLAHK